MRGNADPKGYYRLLGVPQSATADQVRAAFRERAKRAHPDQADHPGGDGTFGQLREAYDVLRDARQRLDYDSQGSADERSGNKIELGEVVIKLGATIRQLFVRAWTLLATPRAGRIGAGLFILALLVLMVVSTLFWSTTLQLDKQTAAKSEIDDRLTALLSSHADLQARYRMSNFIELEQALAQKPQSATSNSFVYSRELIVGGSKQALDDKLRSDLDRTIVELASTIIRIPADRDWVILIEGHAGPAASPMGATSQSWEQMLLHVNDVIDYLVLQGLPADRLAMRFHAGFSVDDGQLRTGDAVEIKLLCCFR